MADMKRINGSGKKVYNWNDAPARRPSSRPRMSQPYRPVRPAARQVKWLPGFAAFVLVLALALGLMSFNDLARSKAKLGELNRIRNSLEEQIDGSARTLKNETKDRVIAQLAREKLYMLEPDENQTVSLYLPQHGATQLAYN